MTHHKIVFSGPVGAGKTTAIRTVSDIPPVQTDVRATDATGAHKETTTVAMDYGALDLGDGDRVHLYGTPGQERFDFMWQILSDGAIGLVLLICNDHPDPLTDLTFFLQAFRPFVPQTHLVVGVTRMDLRRKPALTDYRRVLAERGLHVPLFEVDARRCDDVSLLIQALLLSVDPRLDVAAGAAGPRRPPSVPRSGLPGTTGR